MEELISSNIKEVKTNEYDIEHYEEETLDINKVITTGIIEQKTSLPDGYHYTNLSSIETLQEVYSYNTDIVNTTTLVNGSLYNTNITEAKTKEFFIQKEEEVEYDLALKQGTEIISQKTGLPENVLGIYSTNVINQKTFSPYKKDTDLIDIYTTQIPESFYTEITVAETSVSKVSSNEDIKYSTNNIYKTNIIEQNTTRAGKLLELYKTELSSVYTSKQFHKEILKTSVVDINTNIIPETYNTEITTGFTGIDVVSDYEDVEYHIGTPIRGEVKSFETFPHWHQTEIIESSTQWKEVSSTDIIEQDTKQILDVINTDIISQNTDAEKIYDLTNIEYDISNLISTEIIDVKTERSEQILDILSTEILEQKTRFETLIDSTDIKETKTSLIPEIYTTDINSAITDRFSIFGVADILYNVSNLHHTEIVEQKTDINEIISSTDIISGQTRREKIIYNTDIISENTLIEPSVYNTDLTSAQTDKFSIYGNTDVLFNLASSYSTDITTVKTLPMVIGTDIIEGITGFKVNTGITEHTTKQDLLYLFKIDNQIYYYSIENNEMKLMGDNYGLEDFINYGIYNFELEDMDYSNLTGRDVKLIACDIDDIYSIFNYKFNIDKIPQPQVVLARSDIDLSEVNNISNIYFDYDNFGSSDIYIIMSYNKGDNWITFDQNEQKWMSISTDKYDIVSNAMTVQEANGLSSSEWTRVLENFGNKIRFGYIIDQNNINDIIQARNVELGINLLGRWKKARKNRDFTYSYKEDTLEVKLFTKGTQKINY